MFKSYQEWKSHLIRALCNNFTSKSSQKFHLKPSRFPAIFLILNNIAIFWRLNVLALVSFLLISWISSSYFNHCEWSWTSFGFGSTWMDIFNFFMSFLSLFFSWLESRPKLPSYRALVKIWNKPRKSQDNSAVQKHFHFLWMNYEIIRTKISHFLVVSSSHFHLLPLYHSLHLFIGQAHSPHHNFDDKS